MGQRCARDGKVGDVVELNPSSACDRYRDVYITSEGRVIRSSDDLSHCGIGGGSAVQVMSRMLGGGKHKAKTSSGEETRQEPTEAKTDTWARC